MLYADRKKREIEAGTGNETITPSFHGGIGAPTSDLSLNLPEDAYAGMTTREREDQLRADTRVRELEKANESYGTGKVIGDMVLNKLGLGKPFRESIDRDMAVKQAKWGIEDVRRDTRRGREDLRLQKSMVSGLSKLVDPSSPVHADLSYLNPLLDDQQFIEQMGMPGKVQYEPVMKDGKPVVDPETQLPMYNARVTDKDGKVIQEYQTHAQAETDGFLGSLDPERQQAVVGAIANQAVDWGVKQQMFEYFKAAHPDLKKLIGLSTNPMEEAVGVWEWIQQNALDKKGNIKDELLKNLGWTTEDLAMQLFGKRLDDDRYDIRGELVPDKKSGNMAFSVYDKRQNKSRLIPVEGLTIGAYEDQKMKLIREGALARNIGGKDYYQIPGVGQVNEEQYNAIKNYQSTLTDALETWKESAWAAPGMDPEKVEQFNPEVELDEAAAYYKLLSENPVVQKALKQAGQDPELKKELEALFKEKNLQKLIPLIGTGIESGYDSKVAGQVKAQ